jgi:NADH-quinone oxidoreductase subunit A
MTVQDGPPIILAVHPYASILVLIALAVITPAVILILSHFAGPKRGGEKKYDTYESGMPVIGDARRRFNARFYIVAMLFLLFDVEVIFFWPWAKVFYAAAVHGQEIVRPEGVYSSTFLLVAMSIFFLLLLVGFVYEWRKGVFKWI